MVERATSVGVGVDRGVRGASMARRIVGSTLLIRSRNPNSPHRAEIGKVLVLQSARRRGIATALMDAAEDRARADGRWMLLLDTVTGSAPMPSTDRSAGRDGRHAELRAQHRTARRRRRRSSGRTCGERRASGRVLIAPDSFKGSLTSVEVARALADGWLRARPDDEILLCPLADGGEGTLAAIEAAGGWQRRTAAARDPLGRPIRRAG